jgi:hypothetical protein
MDDNSKLIEELLEKAAEYGKTSFELAKLKALDKSSDVVSTLIPHWVVFVLFATFLLFLNLGVAVWLGEILGTVYSGFFVVAAFYAFAGIMLHFFLRKWLKKIVSNIFIKQVLK